MFPDEIYVFTPKGEIKEFYANGRTHTIANYENGQLAGKYEEYYENGNLKIKGYVIDGKWNNKYLEYGKEAKINAENFLWDRIIENYKRIL